MILEKLTYLHKRCAKTKAEDISRRVAELASLVVSNAHNTQKVPLQDISAG